MDRGRWGPRGWVGGGEVGAARGKLVAVGNGIETAPCEVGWLLFVSPAAAVVGCGGVLFVQSYETAE